MKKNYFPLIVCIILGAIYSDEKNLLDGFLIFFAFLCSGILLTLIVSSKTNKEI